MRKFNQTFPNINSIEYYEDFIFTCQLLGSFYDTYRIGGLVESTSDSTIANVLNYSRFSPFMTIYIHDEVTKVLVEKYIPINKIEPILLEEAYNQDKVFKVKEKITYSLFIIFITILELIIHQ